MSKFYKYFQFIYIAFAIIFIVMGIKEFNSAPNRAYIMFAMAGLALFSFFFRRHFYRKFNNRK